MTTKNTVKTWRKSDPTFPVPFKVGRYNYYSKAEFSLWFAAHRVDSANGITKALAVAGKATAPLDRWGK